MREKVEKKKKRKKKGWRERGETNVAFGYLSNKSFMIFTESKEVMLETANAKGIFP